MLLPDTVTVSVTDPEAPRVTDPVVELWVVVALEAWVTWKHSRAAWSLLVRSSDDPV